MKKVMILATGIIIGVTAVFSTAAVASDGSFKAFFTNYNKVVVNGKKTTLTYKAVTTNNMVYLPVNTVAKLTGYSVAFNSKTGTITLTKPEPPAHKTLAQLKQEFIDNYLYTNKIQLVNFDEFQKFILSKKDGSDFEMKGYFDDVNNSYLGNTFYFKDAKGSVFESPKYLDYNKDLISPPLVIDPDYTVYSYFFDIKLLENVVPQNLIDQYFAMKNS